MRGITKRGENPEVFSADRIGFIALGYVGNSISRDRHTAGADLTIDSRSRAPRR